MPRKQREYLLRYADQAKNDLERAFDRLQLLEKAYSSPIPIPQEIDPASEDYKLLREAESHPKHAQFTRLIMEQIVTAHDWLDVMRNRFM